MNEAPEIIDNTVQYRSNDTLATALLKTFYLVESINHFGENVNLDIGFNRYWAPEKLQDISFRAYCSERPYVEHMLRAATDLKHVLHSLIMHFMEMQVAYQFPVKIEQVDILYLIWFIIAYKLFTDG